MSEQFMRIGGRGADGTAKALRTDNGGRLKTVTALDRHVWGDYTLEPNIRLSKFLRRNGYKYSLIDFLFEGSFTLKIVYYRQPVGEDEGTNLQRLTEKEYVYEGSGKKYHSLEFELLSEDYSYQIINDNDHSVTIKEKDMIETLTNYRQLSKQDNIETIPMTFGGITHPRVNDIETLTSDNVDVSHLKNLQVYMVNNVKTDEESTLAVLGGPGGEVTWANYYDWNTERWVTSGLTEGENQTVPTSTVKVPYSSIGGNFYLNTHPNLYWLENFKGKVLQIRFRTNSLPEAERENFIRGWIVGEKL